jgi:hypothetical protein
MPAVFQIISRATQKSVVLASDLQTIEQFSVLNTYQGSMWTLVPQDADGDFLIQSVMAPDLAIGMFPGPDPTLPVLLNAMPTASAQVWRIGVIPNNPIYFFLLEADNDLVMDLPGGSDQDGTPIQVFPRNQHTNQQWVFLPVFSQLP